MNHLVVAALSIAVTGMTASPARADTGQVSLVAPHNVERTDQTAGIKDLLPPGSPVPKIGPTASMLDYVRWAQNSLSRGQDAEAELSLEWAALRGQVDSIEVAFDAGMAEPKIDDFCNKPLCRAMQDVGRGNRASAMRLIIAIRHKLEEGPSLMRTASR